MPEWVPPDQEARNRITSDLHSNILVEAGAGSGKTTAMVQRLVALIVTGTATIDQIVAVTFTRKAAAELRERFQEALEQAFRSGTTEPGQKQKLRAALDHLDSCFLGTIHAFCSRLLRERPLEAGVPPDYQEVYGAEEELLRKEAWNRFLERTAGPRRSDGSSSRIRDRLIDVGLTPRQLFGLYSQIAENGDVFFPAPPAPAPTDAELTTVRETLQRLLQEALRLMPRNEPEAGWDDLQKRVRQLRFSRDELKWDNRIELLRAALDAVYGTKGVVQNRWTPDPRHRSLVKDLAADWAALDEPDHPVRRTCMRWLAHRYAFAVRFTRAAAAYYAEERLRRGRLTFQDLLLRSVALLREHPDICRELGERYRFLLIDEFQDTDPVQAEVLFRLAARQPAPARDWLAFEPRVGSLFVVGDPKQSIYRFRRADISLYLQVKQHFRAFGAVLELTANFRSDGAVARFVNQTFEARFPAVDDPRLHQATYAPLLTSPDRASAGRVAFHRFAADPGRGWIHIARPDSARIAPWIKQRITSGERQARDFLILTRTKHQLAAFAHELEESEVPYEISGAGIGVEEELRELILLLQALSDPGNPVLTLAVLEGLFFGIDHDTLHEHARNGGHFHLLSQQKSGTLVDEALATLQRMWELARRETADVSIPLIVEELGILPYAAGGELGATRAGALLFALDVLRQGSLAGRTTLAEATELLASALAREDSEAPLLPGATNVVRVMNLHRAKGLEADVVILANPIEAIDLTPRMVQRRQADGSAIGWFAVFDFTTRDRRKPIARPAQWDALEAEEREYQRAEEDRLLYVAATRAAHELVVSRCDRMELKSVWKAFHPLLDQDALASEITLEPGSPRERAELPAEPEPVLDAISHLRTARALQRTPSQRVGGITARLRPDDAPLRKGRRRSLRALQLGLGLDAPAHAETFGHDRAGTPIVQLGLPLQGQPLLLPPAFDPAHVLPAPDLAEARGPEWGEAVHATLQAAGRDLPDLRTTARNALLLAGCPLDAQGEPIWLDELLALADTMRNSALWQRAAQAERVLFEAPFELLLPAEQWSALSDQPASATPELVIGRIDLAFLEEGGWIIADYKTDIAQGRDRTRLQHYKHQLDVYAACWSLITDQPVKERRLVFMAGEDVVW